MCWWCTRAGRRGQWQVVFSLFTTEAARRGCRGLVVDGPIRDVEDLACPTYSTLVSPYAGTVQHPGDETDIMPIVCGGVAVDPGDLIRRRRWGHSGQC
jgi:regulator of RNase E activity RraA